MPNYATPLDRVFQALGDPTRRAVLAQLSRGPSSVSELAAPFSMALPSFVQHLDVLERSGLITSTKTGRVRTCEIAPKAMREAEVWLADQRKEWEQRLDRLDDYLRTLSRKAKRP